MPRKKKIQTTEVPFVGPGLDEPPVLEPDIELPPDNPLCPIRYVGEDGVVRCGAFDFPRDRTVMVPKELADSLLRTNKFEAA